MDAFSPSFILPRRWYRTTISWIYRRRHGSRIIVHEPTGSFTPSKRCTLTAAYKQRLQNAWSRGRHGPNRGPTETYPSILRWRCGWKNQETCSCQKDGCIRGRGQKKTVVKKPWSRPKKTLVKKPVATKDGRKKTVLKKPSRPKRRSL
jgi:hypothetical protein